MALPFTTRREPQSWIERSIKRANAANDLTQWSATAVTPTYGQTDPDGGSTATKLTETVANDYHVVARSISGEGWYLSTGGVSMVGGSWVYEAWILKASTRQYAVLRVGTSVGYEVTLDVQAGTVVRNATDFVVETLDGALVGRIGWVRYRVIFTTNEVAAITAQVALSDTTGAYHSYVGDAAKYIVVWGASLKPFRGAHAIQQLIAYSDDMSNVAWQKTAGVTVTHNTGDLLAPDGTATADKVAYDGSGVSANYRIYLAMRTPATHALMYVQGAWMRTLAGTANMRFSDGTAVSGDLTIGPIWKWWSFPSVSIPATNFFWSYRAASTGNAAQTIYFWHPVGMQTANPQPDYVKSRANVINAARGIR